jgi:hypothetical protein
MSAPLASKPPRTRFEVVFYAIAAAAVVVGVVVLTYYIPALKSCREPPEPERCAEVAASIQRLAIATWLAA